MSASTSPSALPIARLLIIEDEPVLRHSILSYFEELGWQARGAATLAEARRLLADANFDAIVLDVMLPDGDGLTLLSEIGRERTLVVSACPAAARFAENGVRHSMAKPLDLSQVEQALGRVIRAAAP